MRSIENVSHLHVERWVSTRIVSRGRIYSADDLPGFVAVQGGERVGLLTYKITGDECEIITLDSLVEGLGIGSALVYAVRNLAASARCRRLWVITTNDNFVALPFYQKRGFHLVKVHRDALEQSRKLKPEIPLTEINGIILRDETELEMLLG